MNNTKKYFLIIILLIIGFVFITFYSCQEEYRYYRVTKIQVSKDNGTTITKKDEIKNKNKLRNKIVEIVISSKNYKTFVFNGLHFNYDCSGLVNYVYFKAGINLLNYRVKNYNNGVERLFRLGQKYFKLSKTKGYIADVVIFNNTVDLNKNKLYDDFYTHAGIIIDFDKKTKTYKFVHISSKGWSIGYLNLIFKDIFKKNGLLYNSYLRRNDTQNSHTPKKYLASYLFNSFLNIVDYLNDY